jgi:endonuclease-3
VRSLSEAKLADIQERIRDVGLAESKARGLHQAAKCIVGEYGGSVPDTEDKLASLPLVGKKTASAVLVFGFKKPAIPADVHIHRVVNRMGVVRTATLEETSTALQQVVPKTQWHRLNPVLVQHGQNLCRAHKPACDACPILPYCGRVGLP